jgi:hypothetical protein
MQSIYVISTLEKAKKNKYKIGRHDGSPKKLLSRYSTALIDPIIYFFIPVTNYIQIESEIKKSLKKYRIKNSDEKITEWVLLDLFSIINCINNIVSLNAITIHNNNNNNNDKEINNNNDKQINNNFFSFKEIEYNGFYTNSHCISKTFKVSYNSIVICKFDVIEDVSGINHKCFNDPENNYCYDCCYEILIENIHLNIWSIGENMEPFFNQLINFLFDDYSHKMIFVFKYSDTCTINNGSKDDDLDEKIKLDFKSCACINSKLYHCFDVDNKLYIVKLFPKKNHVSKFPNKNKCNIHLFNESNKLLSPSNSNHFFLNKNITHIENRNLPSNQKKIELINHNNFKVYREKFFNKKKQKYSMVNVVFDEPLYLIYKHNPDDIYFKFIADETNYASATGNKHFSFCYRFNKLHMIEKLISLYGDGDKINHLRIIEGFSYYENNNDYQKCIDKNNDVPYPQLCEMMKTIIKNHK